MGAENPVLLCYDGSAGAALAIGDAAAPPSAAVARSC